MSVPGEYEFTVSGDADEEEAAAIAVAVSTYLDARAGGAEENTDERYPDQWAQSGRLETVTGRRRVRPNWSRVDGWTAAARVERL